MYDLKISELPDVGALQDADLLPVVQTSGSAFITSKTTVGDLRNHIESPYFRHYKNAPSVGAYSTVQWTHLDGKESMRFLGWGFTSGFPENPNEFQYAWNSHFNHKFERMAAGYKKNRWQHFTAEGIGLHVGASEDYWAANGNMDGTRVFFAGNNGVTQLSVVTGNNPNGTSVFHSSDRITELSVHDYNTGNQRKILSAGINSANDNYTIINGAYSNVQDPLNPMANAYPLLKVGTYNGGYMMLCGKNGQPLLGSASLNFTGGAASGLFDFDGNKVANLAGGNLHVQNKLYASIYGSAVNTDTDTTIISSYCGFGYTNNVAYKPSVASNPCAFVTLSNGENNSQIMIEKNTGRIFLRYHNGSSYVFKEIQTAAI